MTQPRVTYSQFGEDIIATIVLRNVSSGFYVDIGAHHPYRHSNTALLHLRGWQGVNVEPMQEGIQQFGEYRPHATNVRAAIHNEHDEVTLYKVKGGLANTVLERRVAGLMQTHESAGEEVVPALSINDVFERYVPDGVHVNYMTVDIEGYDTEAILAFDVARYLPDVMCIEVFGPDVLNLGANRVVRHLVSHGYHPYAFNIYSLTFVNVEAAADPDRLNMPRVGQLRKRSIEAGSISGG